MLLSVQGVGKRYDGEQVFSDLSFVLDEGHKVALVGRNGAGKSTLLKVIAGLETLDAGDVVVTSGRTVSYLPQEIVWSDGQTGVEYIQSNTDLLPHQFFPVLAGLGVAQHVADQSIEKMSGGQQSKILLTRFLLEPSDVLLLDEPTNNLDVPALLWLEAFLAASRKSMIIVSHDLMFLDAVTNRVFEIEGGALTVERGTYGDYLERKKKEFDRQMKAYLRYTEEVKRLESSGRSAHHQADRGDSLELSDSDKYIARAGMDRASASQRRANVLKRRIGRMDVVEKPYEDDPFTLALEAQQTDGDIEIVADDLVAGHPDGFSVGPVSFTLKMGDRVCLIGMNGEGKSTILKTLVGILPPLRGGVTVSEGVVLGDLLQQHERADRNMVAIDFFMEQTTCGQERALHTLKRAGFSDQTVRQRIDGLSSGMRARLLFAVFVVLGVNVLLLDEPTNHLDMEAVVALQEMLKTYTGIVLLVSHNRWFLKRVKIDTYYSVGGGSVERVANIDEYIALAKKRAETMTNRMKRIV